MSDTPIPQRLCPDCKVPLERVRDAWTLIPSAGLFTNDDLVVDAYSCPQCGLVRFYSLEQRWKQEAAAKAAARPTPPPQPKEPITGEPWDKPKGKGWTPFRSKD